MSVGPLAKTTLRVAAPFGPRAKPARQPAPLTGAETAIFANLDTRILRRDDSVPATIQIKVDTVNRAMVIGGRGLAAILICLSQVFVQEAPAWAVSMVVHMVTLVTMAMVTTTPAVPYKAPHLVVHPQDEEKAEELVDSNDSLLPTAADDKASIEATAFQSRFEQGGTPLQGPDGLANAGPVGEELSGSGSPDELATVGLTDVGASNMSYSSPELIGIADGPYSGDPSQGNSAATRHRVVPPAGPNEASERAVAQALQWLANHQMPDGGWNFDHANCPACRGNCRQPGRLNMARNAATALALLPFLGNGQTHKESKRYKTAIDNGLKYLLSHMRYGPQGGSMLEPGGQMYSHGIGAIALCEAYAMTRDKNLLVPAGAAINFICYAQDPVGGGWRYQPRDHGDTSMLGWQLMALKSGYMAGMTVPPATIHKASQFLNSVQSEGGTMYGYLDAKGTDATVAIGLLSRMYLGWKRDNPSLQRGVQWLSKRGPSANNLYYNYYATQVMRHWEGEEWSNWNRQMRDQLIHTQARQGHEKGSWFISGGDLGAITGGRLYCTAMAAMILEVYHRYMPIYGQDAVSAENDFPE
jgi:hypothetical protein